MKILRDDEVPAPPTVSEHRETDWAGLATGLVMTPVTLAAAAGPWLLGEAEHGWVIALCLVWALLLALFPWLAFKSFRASRRPDAWLLRWSPEGLYLRFRSRQNWRFPEDTPSVVSLARWEIDWIGKSSASLDAPDEHGHWTRRLRTRSLAIGLKRVDSGPLIAALRAERQRRDHRGVRTNDEPLTIGKDGTLLLELRRVEALIEQLSTRYPTRLVRHEEGKDFESMSTAEREDHILALAQTGQTIAAVKAAREVYGCDLTEAKRLVAELTAR